MFITQMYKYEKDGMIYVSANVPEDVQILETMDILNAEEGFELVRKSDEEHIGNCVWLRDGRKQEDYTEIEAPKDVDESISD